MALKITDLRIDPKSLGSNFLLADISPAYEYQNGERTNKLQGYRYTVVLLEHQYEKIGVKVAVTTPIIDLEKEEIPVGSPVKFTNLEVKSYFSKGQINLSATADSIAFVNPPAPQKGA